MTEQSRVRGMSAIECPYNVALEAFTGSVATGWPLLTPVIRLHTVQTSRLFVAIPTVSLGLVDGIFAPIPSLITQTKWGISMYSG